MYNVLAICVILGVLLVGCERLSNNTSTVESGNSTNLPSQESEATKLESTLLSNRKLVTVKSVDLDRYMGEWYEIARYPNAFQRNVVGVIADYRKRDDGRLDVINSGRIKTLDGKVDRSEVVGWVVDKQSNAKWKVQFLWPFSVPYWIIDLHAGYEYAVVGQPSRKFLWVLSRKPQMSEETYQGICERLTQ